jgi:electron transfer flavoprotein alpha subunit
MKILVYIDQRAGVIKKASLEALSLAAELNSNGSAADIACVVVGEGIDTKVLEGYGADQVFVIGGEVTKNFNCLVNAKAVESVVRSFDPALILGVASPMGKDLFPRLAARFDGGIASDVTKVEISGSGFKVAKPMFAGKILANMTIDGGAKVFITLRPNVFAVKHKGQGKAAVVAMPAASSDPRLQTIEIRKGKSERADLTEASLIVSGGRALASAENFKILFDCADSIGASVGASRAAVDSGFASHDMQVGQTGKTVNPNLYISCGMSGSIQHMAGMRTSKYIVAINTDREAPIFGIADYGIVADLFEVVPALTKAFKALKAAE